MKLVKSNRGMLDMSLPELRNHIKWLQELSFTFSIKGNDKAAEHLVLWRLKAETILFEKEMICNIYKQQ